MDDYNLFEEYLENQLSAADKTVFEQRLKNDAVFAGKFEEYRSIQTGMQTWLQTADQRTDLKKTLEQLTTSKNKPTKIRSLKWYLSRVAAILLLAAGVWWISGIKTAKTGNELYAKYVSGETISMQRGNRTDSLWSKAGSALYDKKYTDAAASLQQIINSGKDSTQEAQVWLGYCYLLTNKDEAAATIFTKTDFRQKQIAEQAKWYEALLYLKTNRKEACVTLLKQLTASGGAYAGKAAALLKEKGML